MHCVRIRVSAMQAVPFDNRPSSVPDQDLAAYPMQALAACVKPQDSSGKLKMAHRTELCLMLRGQAFALQDEGAP